MYNTFYKKQGVGVIMTFVTGLIISLVFGLGFGFLPIYISFIA